MASNPPIFSKLCEKVNSLVHECQLLLTNQELSVNFEVQLTSVSRTVRKFINVIKSCTVDINDQDTKKLVTNTCLTLEAHVKFLRTFPLRRSSLRLSQDERNELVFHFQGILLNLQEVLFHVNEAEIQAILELSQTILKRIADLECSSNSSELLSGFKGFVRDLEIFSKLVVWKLQLIADQGLSERTFDILHNLKHHIRTFSSASIHVVSDQSNNEAKLWQSYSASEIARIVREVPDMLFSYTDSFRNSCIERPISPSRIFFSGQVEISTGHDQSFSPCLKGKESPQLAKRLPSRQSPEQYFTNCDLSISPTPVYEDTRKHQHSLGIFAGRCEKASLKLPVPPTDDLPPVIVSVRDYQQARKDRSDLKRTLQKYITEFDTIAAEVSDGDTSERNVERLNTASENLLTHVRMMNSALGQSGEKKRHLLSGLFDAKLQQDFSNIEVQLNAISEYTSCLRSIVDVASRNVGSSQKAPSDLENRFLQLQEATSQLFTLARKSNIDTGMEESQLTKFGKIWYSHQDKLLEVLNRHLSPWILIARRYKETCGIVYDQGKLVDDVITYRDTIKRLKYVALTLGRGSTMDLEYKAWESSFSRQQRMEDDIRVLEGLDTKLFSFVLGDKRDQDDNAEAELLRWACAARDIYNTAKTTLQRRKTGEWSLRKAKDILQEMMESSKELVDLVPSGNEKDDLEQMTRDLNVIKQRFGLEKKSSLERCIDDVLLPVETAAKRMECSLLIDRISKDTKEPIKFLLEALDGLSPSYLSFDRGSSLIDKFKKKMDCVEIHAALAVQNSYDRQNVHRIFTTLDDIKLLTDSIIEATESSSVKPDDFKWLCKKWQIKAFVLESLLRKIPDVNFDSVTAVMRHLHSNADLCSVHEFCRCTSPHPNDTKHSDLESSGFFESVGSQLYLPSVPEIKAYDFDSEVDNLLEKRDGPSLMDNDNNLETPDVDENPPVDEKEIEVIDPSLFPTMSPVLGEDREDVKNEIADDKDEITDDKDESGGNEEEKKDYKEEKKDYKEENDDRDNQVSQGIQEAASVLRKEAGDESGLDSAIVDVVKQMADQMFEMAEFARGRGALKSRTEMIHTAKAIAMNAKAIEEHARDLSDECKNVACKNDLLHYAEVLPTISTQLRVISSVKDASPEDESADVMLVTNADNLMKAVVGTLKAIRAASVERK